MQSAGMVRLLRYNQHPRLRAVDFHVAGRLSPCSHGAENRKKNRSREFLHNANDTKET